ncbi:zinc dependent phospholipase C family protein [Alkalibacillus haloalkaliphilus]|uniref:Hydrolase n=1 Tax=Alkalibacillus haloalkaliphilus TaxID=94136 RepID=A0A511W236_9BACI|nr:zinc dependent phospholipase C family protein [Alkalibacillus haloalkaliphilus]GEN45047.1 hypothetical protein AHA02nite_08230 [Alkalibacillus haloalkaliphilus]
MGSRIMHLVIANRILENIVVTDRTAFLLGGIAPDAVSPKEKSHFYSGEHHNYTRIIDYEAFYSKYKSLFDDDYIKGYYTHLIADDLWLQGFYLPWLKNRMEADEQLYKSYHRDFWLLNAKLVEYYGYQEELVHSLDSNLTQIIDLEEVKQHDVVDFTNYVLDDLEFDRQNIDEKLEVFTLQQIVGYIETSVEQALYRLSQHKIITV